MKNRTTPRGFVPMSKTERKQFNNQKIRRLEGMIKGIEKEIKALK